MKYGGLQITEGITNSDWTKPHVWPLLPLPCFRSIFFQKISSSKLHGLAICSCWSIPKAIPSDRPSKDFDHYLTVLCLLLVFASRLLICSINYPPLSLASCFHPSFWSSPSESSPAHFLRRRMPCWQSCIFLCPVLSTQIHPLNGGNPSTGP